MIGTAYRTPTPPPEPNGNDEAIYAVYPPVVYGDRQATTFLFVSASPLVWDTTVYPCTREGHVLSLRLLACVSGLDHAMALRMAGYEKEEVVPRVA